MRRSISARMAASSSPRSDGEASGSDRSSRVKAGNVRIPTPDDREADGSDRSSRVKVGNVRIPTPDDGEADGLDRSSRVKVGNVRIPTPDGLKPPRSSSISARQSKLDVNIVAFTRESAAAENAAEKERAPAERLWTWSRRGVRNDRRGALAARRRRRGSPTRNSRRLG